MNAQADTGSLPTSTRPALDVSGLPAVAADARAPIWWGNTLFMLIETVSTTLLLASYFYLRQGNAQWPPVRADAGPGASDPLPGLGLPTINALLLAASCLPMAWVDWSARRGRKSAVRNGLLLLIAVGALATTLRFYEFSALKFRWDENAYSSAVWWILGVHLTYVAAATLEVAVVAMWILLYGMDESMAVDVTLAAVYWYWMVALWVPLYLAVFWSPRWPG